jgi:hypothetical protein
MSRMILRWLPVLSICLVMLSGLPHAAADVPQFIVLTNQLARPPLVGYGVEMSPYLTAPNAGQPVGDLDDLERKLKALAPQHVRIFVRTDWWRPGNERIRDSFIRTCQLAQAAGATINVTLWTGWEGNPAQASSEMAGLLKDLIVNRSLGAVRYVTLQNEVNSTKITMEQYNAFYRRFDEDLRRTGIRDKILIVGGDLVRTRQADWLRDLATELAPVCDGHSIHIYWDYTQASDAIRRLRGIAAIPDSFPAQDRRPLYITEFGVRGKDWQEAGKEPGVYEDGTPMTQTGMAALQVGWLMTEATRRGFVATVQWEAYDVAYGKHPMHYGLMGEPGEGWPLRPAYQVLRLFTHTIAPGWRAVQVEGDSTNVALAAVQGPDGELTIMALNHSKAGQPVSVARLPPGGVFHRVFWTAAKSGQLQEGSDVTCAAGLLEMDLPPQSLTALTDRSNVAKDLGIDRSPTR